MPENPPSQRDILAELMAGGQRTLVPHLAEMLRRYGIRELDSSEERDRFWQRALTPEQEQMLWQAEMQNRGITDLTPEQAVEIGLGISKKVFPTRWDMATAEGREHESDVAAWAWGHARKGPPKQRQEPEQPPVEAPSAPAMPQEGEGY